MEPALRQLGLTTGEARVYLALLREGASTTGPLTDASGVSRSKIYSVLDRLAKKGLVSVIVKEGVRNYQASDPSMLHEYIDKKAAQLETQRKKVDELIPLFREQTKVGSTKTTAQLYIGFRGLQAVHENTYRKLKKGDEYFYLGISPLDTFQEEHDWYWQKDHRKRESKGIKCRLLFNKETKKTMLDQRNNFDGCDARYMPISVNTPAWILGYSDVTAIGFLAEESVMIEITNERIAQSFKSYFEWFWSKSSPENHTKKTRRK